jgi:hypothetical protein
LGVQYRIPGRAVLALQVNLDFTDLEAEFREAGRLDQLDDPQHVFVGEVLFAHPPECIIARPGKWWQ